MTSKTEKFATGLEDVAADLQGKAKDAFATGSAFLKDAAEFAEGNAKAVVEAGKTLAKGLKDITETNMAEGRKAFETLTADAKGYAAVKSPADFFQLHSEVLRRQFDSAMALSSKNTESVLKLAEASFAPIAGRINVAAELAKKAA